MKMEELILAFFGFKDKSAKPANATHGEYTQARDEYRQALKDFREAMASPKQLIQFDIAMRGNFE